MDADLDDQILRAALFVELVHGPAHPQARGKRMLRLDERRHHGIADGLHDSAFFRRDDFQQRMEMRADQIERGEVADAFVERRGALEVGEQEGQRGDLEPLIDVEIVGLVDVAKGLVGQHAFCGEDRLAFAEHLMQRVAGNPHRRKHADAGLVFERQP